MRVSTSSTSAPEGPKLECVGATPRWDERQRRGASMIGGRSLSATVAIGLALFVSTALAQQRGVGSPAALTLTAQDYAEIQQLSNRYAWAIDVCTNAGY